MPCKILSAKGLEVKILTTKELGPAPLLRDFCVHHLRLGNDLLFEIQGQGRMSQWPEEKLEIKFRKSWVGVSDRQR